MDAQEKNQNAEAGFLTPTPCPLCGNQDYKPAPKRVGGGGHAAQRKLAEWNRTVRASNRPEAPESQEQEESPF